MTTLGPGTSPCLYLHTLEMQLVLIFWWQIHRYNEEVSFQCMLHVTGDKEHSGDAVIPFTKQTWETARCIAQARKQHQKRPKYLVVCIP